MLLFTSHIKDDRVPFVNPSEQEAYELLAQAIGELLSGNAKNPEFRRIARQYAEGHHVLFLTLHMEESVL